MVEWDVPGEDEAQSRAAKPHPPARRRTAWRLLAGLLLLALLLGVWLIWREARAREADLRADLTQVVLDEERTFHFGVAEQASELADPDAPVEWLVCYEAAFRIAIGKMPIPKITSIERQGSVAVVVLHYRDSTTTWQTQRAYRLVNNRWRRTPLAAMQPGAHEATSTPHFRLLFSDGTVEASLDLETLRQNIIDRWPHNSCPDCVITMTLLPHPLVPPVFYMDARQLCLNNPDLVPPDSRSPLSPEMQYQLALVTGVVGALTIPDWLQAYPSTVFTPTSELMTTTEVSQEWLALLLMLQEAEARHWLLTEAQQRAVRNAWREELGGVWRLATDGQLPLNAREASGDARRRWLNVNLLIEYQVAHGGDESTIGLLARTLLSYQPATFDAVRFFAALIGGSPSDLEFLSRDYVLGREE